MLSRSVVDTRIFRRRQRLILDYQLQTHAKLEAYSTAPRWTKRTVSHCFASFRRQFLPHYYWSPPGWRIWIRQLTKERALPDFCIIGPMKSGTSDLAVTIMSHPNVLCPLVKEFSSTDPLAWKPFYPTVRAVRRHARRHGVALCPFVGPCLHCLDIPITLSALQPQTKIIINLRNPVDLTFSMWKWTVLHTERRLVERVPYLTTFSAYVDKAIEVFPLAPAPFGSALHHGIYATSVAHWLSYFGHQNVRIFDVAEYFTDRNSYFEHLEGFLGLPHVQLPRRLPVANPNPLEELGAVPETSAKLRRFFDSYNRSLWDVIGTVYSW
jgi:Sulfotransferase domain